MTGAAQVVTIGEALAVLAQSDPAVLRSGAAFTFRIGGAESNVAIGLARLGVPAAWMGRLGGDPIGDEVVRVLRGEGVRVLARRDGHRATGLLLKERRTSVHQRIASYRAGSAGAALEAADIDGDAVAAARVLHLTGVTLAISASAAGAVRHAVALAEHAGARVSFDVNHRSHLWSESTARTAIRSLLPQVDVLYAGLAEAALVLGESPSSDAAAVARQLQRLGPREVVLKLGAGGALAVDGDTQARAPGRAVPVVDTVGAGDAFVAGYLAASLAGKALPERLDTACRTGAFACMSGGDWEGAPGASELTLLDDTEPVRR